MYCIPRSENSVTPAQESRAAAVNTAASPRKIMSAGRSFPATVPAVCPAISARPASLCGVPATVPAVCPAISARPGVPPSFPCGVPVIRLRTSRIPPTIQIAQRNSLFSFANEEIIQCSVINRCCPKAMVSYSGIQCAISDATRSSFPGERKSTAKAASVTTVWIR